MSDPSAEPQPADQDSGTESTLLPVSGRASISDPVRPAGSPVVVDIDAEPGPPGSSNEPATPTAVPYDPAPRREAVRTGLAVGLSIVTVLIGAVLLAAGLGGIPISPLLTGIFTPFFGITGTIIGFYFGGGDATKR